MLNEGIIVNDAKALVGHDRDEVDWEIEGNQAGYYTWMRN